MLRRTYRDEDINMPVTGALPIDSFVFRAKITDRGAAPRLVTRGMRREYEAEGVGYILDV